MRGSPVATVALVRGMVSSFSNAVVLRSVFDMPRLVVRRMMTFVGVSGSVSLFGI